MEFKRNKVYVVRVPALFDGPALALGPRYFYSRDKYLEWTSTDRDHGIRASQVVHEDDHSITFFSGDELWTFEELTMETWQEIRPYVVGAEKVHFETVDDVHRWYRKLGYIPEEDEE